MSKLVIGTNLKPETRKYVLAAYTYRLTTENGYPKRNPCNASVPAISDTQWLAEHAFYVNRDGALSANRNYCEPAFMVDSE